LESGTGQATNKTLERLTRAIDFHRQMLHECLYPALEPFQDTAAYLALDSRNETQLNRLIKNIEENQPPEQHWTNRLAQISELWRAHVQQSERQLFPEALRLLGRTKLQQLHYEMDSVRTHQSDLDSAIYPATRLGPKS
jgi:hypothetical protein